MFGKLKNRLIVIYTIIICFYISLAFGQIEDDSTMFWNCNRYLKWSDFKGVPVNNSFHAVSSIRINSKAYIEDGLPVYKIYSLFYKDSSWTNSISSFNLLKHEQLHFDIAELFSRKIRKRIELLRNKRIESVKEYSNVIKEEFKNYDEFDRQYDFETDHGMIELEQLKWNKLVEDELTLLEKYAVPCLE